MERKIHKNLPKLDRKDRLILLELDNDASQSYKRIGKKLRISKDVVAYRIKRLEDEKVITSYLTVSHFSKIGLNHYKLYIKYAHITNEKKQEIIDFLLKQENIGWLASTEGTYDLMVAIRFRNIHGFEEFKDDFFSRFDHYFQKNSFAIMTEAETYPRTYFTEMSPTSRKVFKFCGNGEQTKIDETDMKIIKALSDNGRLSTAQIAVITGLTERVVRYRKKQLENNGILVGYKLAINYRKLDYVFFKCLIKFQKMTREKMKEIKNYARMHPNVIHWLKVIGEWDLELELEAPSMEEFYEVANDFRVRFNDTIQTFDAALVSQEHAIKHA